MTIVTTSILDLLIIEPKIFSDSRGFFYESFNELEFQKKIGKKVYFVQDNHSRSTQRVLRGLHYQVQQPQGKLVRVIRGAVFDVAVDLRLESPTFGQWEGIELSEENQKQLWIPPGFAHGFFVLTKNAEVLYKATDYYAPQYERTINWNDPTINIQWPTGIEVKLSDKDRGAISFENAMKELNL